MDILLKERAIKSWDSGWGRENDMHEFINSYAPHNRVAL